ncbi:hypothetical protein C8Q75DRAFT_724367 [Abortiporus biennis]|nr:hypothetical protein C8Q75DRAFT_724367 [Abortiporus biennis]
MATTARQPKQARKGMPDSAPRRNAWQGPRASPTFSPGTPNSRLPNGSQPAAAAATPSAFPPLAQTQLNGTAPRTDRPQDRVLQQLSGLTGTTITLSTKTNQRYEGVIASTSGEGDTTGVSLKDVKELTQPGAPLKDQLFIAATNIDTWASGPADAKASTNGADSFKTDVDISAKAPVRKERELKAWSDEVDSLSIGPMTTHHVDDMTFGPGASTGGNGWDQFAVNEQLFGVKANFDEDVYTTKIDRSAPDYKEKEKKAQAIAAEILGVSSQSTTVNTHVAEERVMNFAGTDDGTKEEDKYGAVVRGANAYVPPGARRANPIAAKDSSASAKPEIPKVSVNAPDGTSLHSAGPVPTSVTSPNVTKVRIGLYIRFTSPSADPVPAFRDFVSSERDRLMKKKQALMKSEMDKRMAELVKFSKNFKLNKPIPDDLVPILAKDEEKQRQIKEKSTKDAESSHARTIGVEIYVPASSVRLNQSAVPGSAKPTAPALTKQQAAAANAKASAATKSSTVASKGGDVAGSAAAKSSRISMVIQAIPPFKGKRTSTASGSGAPTLNTSSSVTRPTANGAAASPATPLSPNSVNRLNVNASSFRPTVKPFSPSGTPSTNGPNSATASPKPKEAAAAQNQAPNPFFGTKPIKKGPVVHIKDDFNPFKYNKVAEASAVSAMWPYNGKRYMQLFPPLPSQPQQQSPHMAPPQPPPPMQPAPPSTYEEDNNAAAAAAAAAAQAQARYVYYPPYGYPGQPMMPGMAPPPPGYMPAPFMQPIPYPHMPPNGMFNRTSLVTFN